MVERFTPELLATMSDGEIVDRLFRLYPLNPCETDEAIRILLEEIEGRGLDHKDLICALEDYRTLRRSY